ncbi:hypothetical protein ES708_30663 [subsurface metagenome]
MFISVVLPGLARAAPIFGLVSRIVGLWDGGFSRKELIVDIPSIAVAIRLEVSNLVD